MSLQGERMVNRSFYGLTELAELLGLGYWSVYRAHLELPRESRIVAGGRLVVPRHQIPEIQRIVAARAARNPARSRR